MPESLFTLRVTITGEPLPIVVKTGLTWDQGRQIKTDIYSQGLYIKHDNPETEVEEFAVGPDQVAHTWYPPTSFLKMELVKE